MKNRTVSATEFKAKCLAILDEVQKGGSVTVTKRGKPVAVVSRAPAAKPKSLKGIFAGKAEIVGDIVNLDMADRWNVVTGR